MFATIDHIQKAGQVIRKTNKYRKLFSTFTEDEKTQDSAEIQVLDAIGQQSRKEVYWKQK